MADHRFQHPLRQMAVLALFVAVLVGCDDAPTRNLLDQRAAEARQSLTEMDRPTPAKRYNPLVVSDRVWMGGEATRMHRGVPLPVKYETQHGVTLVSSEPMSLADIMNAISTGTGIPVHLSDVGPRTGGSTSTTQVAAPMPLAYEGPLSGLMEKVAGYFGVNWRYDGATISVARFESRTFIIEALPGTQKVSEGMQDDTTSGSSGGGSGGGGGGGGGSGGGGSSSQNSMTQNSKFDIDIKYWDDLNLALTSMLGGTGTVVTSPSLGTVTITTTPEIMRKVAEYITEQNARLSRQIAINVEVYSINLNEGMDFNIAFKTAIGRLSQGFAANITSGAAGPTTISGFSGGGSLSVAILNPSTAGQITDVFTALSGIGDTTRVARFPLVTLNNRPVSRRVGEDVGFVASSSTTNTGVIGSGSAVSSSLTPGTVHQGFSVQLTPRLLDDGRILLQYSLNVIDIKAISQFNSQCGAATTGSTTCTGSATGSSTIELPDTLNRIFVQQSVLKSGSTLLIAGAEEEDLKHSTQGVGDPYNYLLGGGSSSARVHTMLFVALSPQVLDEPHSEHE